MGITEIWEIVAPAIPETIYMMVASAFLSIVIGLPTGILLAITREGGLSENKVVYTIFDWVVNILRSLPFVILLFLVMPLTRLIVGTTIGTTAAIVPLTISGAPFVARLMETHLLEVDKGVIEAAHAMGTPKLYLIFHVMLPESMPAIVNGITLTIVNLISYSAMAGLVGGGGLGDIANRYGYQREIYSIMLTAIVVIIIIVQLVQIVGNRISNKLNKK